MKIGVDKNRVIEIVMKSGRVFRFDASWYVIDKCNILNVYSYRFRGIHVFSAKSNAVDSWEYVFHVEAKE